MIVAADILFRGHLYRGKPFEERHHHIIHQIAAKLDIRPVKGEQGFMDDKDNFLTREEALDHAIECNQVIVGKAKITHVCDGKRLYSEDLW